MSPVLRRPPRAPRSRPVKPPGWRKGPRRPETRATGPDEAGRTTQGHEACQRSTPPATTKADRQVPSNNSRRVPQTRRVRTTRNEPQQENRGKATPAALWMDVCARGSEPSPCRLRNSRRPDGRMRARRIPSPCRLQTPAVRMDECAPRSYTPHKQHSTRNTQHTERAHR